MKKYSLQEASSNPSVTPEQERSECQVGKECVRRVWTIGKLGPLQLGGHPVFVLATDMPVTGPYDIGKGYQVYTATSPKGTEFVFESTTGASVGHQGLAQVIKDMEGCSPELAAKQVKQAAEWFDSHVLEVVEPAEFWSRLPEATNG